MVRFGTRVFHISHGRISDRTEVQICSMKRSTIAKMIQKPQ